MSGGIERIGWAVRWHVRPTSGKSSLGWMVPGGVGHSKPYVWDGDDPPVNVVEHWEGILREEGWVRDFSHTMLGVFAAPEGTIESLEAENRELRGVVEKYGDDPDYARSRFRQIDLMVDQRAHDRLKIDGLEKEVDRLKTALATEATVQRIEADVVDRLQDAHHQIESLEAERDELRHEVTTLNEMGADLTRERDELRATVERYREALEEITENGCEGLDCWDNENPCWPCVARRALNPEEEA